MFNQVHDGGIGTAVNTTASVFIGEQIDDAHFGFKVGAKRIHRLVNQRDTISQKERIFYPASVREHLDDCHRDTCFTGPCGHDKKSAAAIFSVECSTDGTHSIDLILAVD